jgi:hypothetical protein
MTTIKGDNLPNIFPREKCTGVADSCPLDAKGMKGHRHRDADGELHAKSGATHLGTLEDTYGEISPKPDDTHLKKLRIETGERGLDKVIKKERKIGDKLY